MPNFGLKRPLKALLRRVPFKRQILSFGATVPPLIKGRFFESLMRSIAENEDQSRILVTNLGMDSAFRFTTPLTYSWLVFGVPETYTGESASLHLAALLAKDASSFVDVGAHRGYFTFYLWAKTRGRIPLYFFEPNPHLFAPLSENVERNKLKAQGFRVALADKEGTATFYVNTLEDLRSSLLKVPGVKKTEEIEVEVSTFAAFAKKHSLNKVLVKVDVEGVEEEFVEGIGTESSRIEYLIIELLGSALKQDIVRKIQKNLGMQCYYIAGHTLVPSLDENVERVQSELNWLFCRLSPEELRGRLAGSKFRVSKFTGK